MSKIIEQIAEEIRDLEEAKQLLGEIWAELGPYTQALSQKLVVQIQKYYNFDDSE
jgi:hypothetical protein